MPQPLPNPLLPLHEAGDAETQAYDQTEIVSTFGAPELEYAAIHRSCGLMDLPQRALIELTGNDRLPFLNNLVTNQTWDKNAKTPMPPGTGVYAFFLSRQGRIFTDLNILDLGDRTLLEIDGRLVEPVLKELDRYLFGEKVKMAGKVGELHQFALHGPGAKAMIDTLADPPPGDLPPLGVAATRIMGHDVVVWRDDPCAVPGYTIILPAAAAPQVWQTLCERFGGGALPKNETPEQVRARLAAATEPPPRRLLRPIGWAAFNAARIEGGRPLFGIDFDDTILPAETGQLARAVSFTKGCYLGQEIVARMHARNVVAKQLVGLRMEDDALPIAGAAIYDDQQNQVGGVTSSTLSPILSNAALCLALLKKPFFVEGTAVNVPAEGKVRKGKVARVPFDRE